MNQDFIEIKHTKPTEPTKEEIKEYAKWLGADVEKDQDLFYIAREGLLADIPPGWKLYQKKNGESEPFYFNLRTGESLWDHPLDKYYVSLFQKEKLKKMKKFDQIDKEVHLPTEEPRSSPNQCKLSTKSILTVPFQIFNEDFTFIVNDTEYKTSKLFADLLSPVISKMHVNDATFDTYEIKTIEKGDFGYVLKLLNFENNEIPIEEIPFLIEVFEILGTESVKSTFFKRPIVTILNVLDLIQKHEKFNVFYQNQLNDEIDFLASNFYEIADKQEKKLSELSLVTLERVLSNDKIVLNSEDQLLNFVNMLYSKNNDFSILYEYVNFLNVSKSTIDNFLNTFKFESMSRNIWMSVIVRLREDVAKFDGDDNLRGDRYFRQLVEKEIPFKGEDSFNGIIKYLTDNSSEIEITASSSLDGQHVPQNLIVYDNSRSKYFASKNLKDSWVLFDFKTYLVAPTHYILMSDFSDPNECSSPKEWVIEGSNDNENWTVIDCQSDVAFMNARSFVHTFSIENLVPAGFRYVRMRLTGKNWNDDDSFKLGSIEFYGKLFSNES